MRKIHKKVITGALALALLMTNSMAVSAESYSRSINGIGFSVYSNISSSGGTSGTVSSSSQLSVSVSTTYGYVNTTTYDSKTEIKNASGTATQTLSFTAPNGCRSVGINSSHGASSGGESWSGTTSANYP